ncbi:hypothetical protein Cgig2_012073 [Carnegiea gigantea]|uniref:Ty3 transposon capsid-like protein domain-containing protein n=1 Tax=Carnegiea gigantea TaxID=171969 RepID=A0A9Q1JP67_9CARY|nr:hypothetical protein Cgig2_012073 [Carnegiea gigantea]
MGSQIVEDFNRLSQTGIIDEYLERFEELKSLMLVKNPLLPADYFVDSFIGGLVPQIKSFTRAFKPTTLTEAVNYARLQEATIQAMKAPDRNKSLSYQKLPQRGLLPTPTATGFKPLASPPPVMPANKPKTLTAAERADKLAKGLCFFCDQVYEKGHQCNNKKTNLEVSTGDY